MDHTYYIDRDPRPKSRPCHHCARDVEAGHACTCVPAQPRGEVVTLTMCQQVRGLHAKAYPMQSASNHCVDQPKITTANGLLYRDGKMIPLPEADEVAVKHGHYCAERFVRALAELEG